MSTPTLTIRKPEDVLLVLPHLFGFQPREGDLCLLNFTPGKNGPHARVDLPLDPSDMPELVDAMHAVAQHVTPDTKSVVISFGASPRMHEVCVQGLATLVPNIIEQIEVDPATHQWRKGGSLVWRAWPVDEAGLTAPLVADGSAPRESRDAMVPVMAPVEPGVQQHLADLNDFPTLHGQAHVLVDSIATGDHDMVAALVTSDQMRDVAMTALGDTEGSRERVAFMEQVLAKYGAYNPRLIDLWLVAHLRCGICSVVHDAYDLYTQLGLEPSPMAVLLHTMVVEAGMDPRGMFDAMPTFEEML